MGGNTVLFKVEVDSQGAVQGFRVSRKELQKLRREAEKAGVAGNQGAKGMKRMGQETKKAGQHAKHAGSSMHSMQLIMAGMFAIATVRQAILYADTFKNLDARIRVSTDSLQAFNRAQAATQDIAQRTFSTIESTTELYARLSLAMRDTEVAQESILTVTETLNKAYQSAGATAQEASASVIQLSQGLAAGALRGDEFRSVIEQAPRVVTALTDALGLTRGELRLLANDGKLTTEVIIQALLEQGEAIDKEFQAIELTVGRAFTLLRNESIKYIGEADAATGVTEDFANAVKSLSENLDTVATVGIAAVTVALIAFAPAIASATIAFGALIVSMGPFGLAAIGIGIAVVALREYFDAVNDAAGATRSFADAIKGLATTEGLKDRIDLQREAISELRAEAEALKDEFVDLEDEEQINLPFFDMKPGEIESRKTEIIQALAEIDAVVKSRTDSLTKLRGELGKLTEEEQKAIKTARELLDQERLKKEALKEYKDALKLAKGAVSKFGDEQQKAALINEKYDAQLEKIRKGLVGVVGFEDLLAASILAVSKARLAELAANRTSIDSIKKFKDALRALQRQLIDTNEEGFLQLELMLEEVENQFGDSSTQAEELRARLEALRLELDGVAEAGKSASGSINFRGRGNIMTAGGFQFGLGSSLQQARKMGETMGGAFAGFMEQKGAKIGAAAFALGSFANFQAFKDQGATTLEAINEVAKSIPIPEVQAIAEILSSINAIFGGGLFGTKFKTEASMRSFSIDAGGASGGIEIDQKKKKSFFRGTKRRTLFEGLDPETQKAISDLFQAALDAMTGAVEALGVTAPAFIAGKFQEEFDADGNLTKSISTFFGRTFEESFQEFSMRLVAENLIAAVGEAVGQVEITRTISQPIGSGDFREIGIGGDFTFLEQTTEMVSEAFAIAERWRDSAELLLDGAKLLLSAQSAIQEGNGLLDSLTATVNLVEELQGVGETLVQAFDRIVGSVDVLQSALDLLDQNFDLGRESFVRFAEAFTDAAGSVGNAATLWKNYFSTFFDADELLDARLRVAQGVSAKELADIGLAAGVGRDEFRRLFEDILPTLSADALNEWLQAASALGVVLDLEDQLNKIRAGAGDTVIDDPFPGISELMQTALDLIGTTFDLTTDEFKQFAEEFAGLAGDVNSAADLWRNYFDVFFDADELIVAKLEFARNLATVELSDVGLGFDVGRDEFRRLFEDILPTLSAAALNEWLQAADALGLVLDLEEQLAVLRGEEPTIIQPAAIKTAIEELGSAFDLLGLVFDKGSEAFKQFAKDFTLASGDVSAATALWRDYFNAFFDANELLSAQLVVALRDASSELADIGLSSGVGRDEFKALFEAVLGDPNLSGEALTQWLEAASALGLVLDLEEQLAALRGEAPTVLQPAAIETAIDELSSAFDLLGLVFDKGGDEFKQFAKDFTLAAGDVDSARSLWDAYFNTFLNADELLEARLRVAQRVSAQELADVGLGAGVGRDEFRRLFESVLPTLSAEALNEWLQAADALGLVLDLEEQLANIRTESVEDLITAFDDVRSAVDDILGSTINDLRRELLSPEALFNELKTSALGLAGQISGAQSREEVLSLVSEINALVRDTRGVAGDTRFNAGLIDFLQQVSAGSDIRLGELQASAIADAELALREISSREGFVNATATFAESVQTFGDLITADGGIVISGNDGSTLQESIANGIRESFDIERMDSMFSRFEGAVSTFEQINQFQAENPPTIRIDQTPSEIGLS